MKLNNLEREIEFEARIDARFPYRDPAACTALIAEAQIISFNAACCVLDEICRPPKSDRVKPERQRELVEEWSSHFDHELKEPLLACAAALIDRRRLDWREAVAIMERVGKFDGQRAALSLAYFSGDCDSDEGDAALEAAHERITQVWAKLGL